MMLKWLVTAVIVYGGFVALLYLAQRLFQYFPERRRTAPSAVGLTKAEEVVLDTADGELARRVLTAHSRGWIKKSSLASGQCPVKSTH
jgi:hypothetical protein